MRHINLQLLFLLILSSIISVCAQFSGTDTLENGRTYYEVNFWTGTQKHENGGMQIYGGRAAYGLTKKMEIGVGASFSDPHDAEYPPEIQPGIKYKFYENEKYGVTAAGGAIAFVPIARQAGTDAFVMIYANASKQFRSLKNPRLTVGGYTLAARNPGFGSRAGWNFAYDQPLTRKIGFSAQWTTGKNRFGYFTPGFNITLPKNSSLFIGYSIGNHDYDNHGPYVSYNAVR